MMIAIFTHDYIGECELSNTFCLLHETRIIRQLVIMYVILPV